MLRIGLRVIFKNIKCYFKFLFAEIDFMILNILKRANIGAITMGSFWIIELSRKIKRMAAAIPNKAKETIEVLNVQNNPDKDSFENLSF